MSSVLADLRYAVRTLLTNPGFTVAALATLALGIGANTAIFSLADAVLLRAPPVHDGHRLGVVYTTCRRGDLRCSSSYPDYEDYRDRSTAFADMAAYSSVPLNVGDEAGARLATGMLVTGNYFQLLGVVPAAGRLLQPNDNRRGAPQAVAVLSHAFWRSHFSGAEEIVGRSLRLNGSVFTVVGVSPAGFTGLDLGGQPDLFVPMLAGQWLGDAAGAAGRAGIFDDRASRWIHATIGRLAEGATIAQARSEMLAISAQLAEEDPQSRGSRSVTVDALPGYLLPIDQRAALVRFVAFLATVVGFTLLLASANLANLLLGRAVARRREIGIRVAIGASRRRLLRQLLTESLLLAAVGGMLGLLVATWTLDLLSGFELPGRVGVAALEIDLDLRVLTIAGALVVVTGILFGALPAWQSSRPDVVMALKGGTSQPGRGRPTLRRSLMAVQVAVCLILLVGSGVFVRTMQKALALDLGFDPHGVTVARFNLALLRYTPERAHTFVTTLLERLRGLPWVDAASVSTLMPFEEGGFQGTFVSVDGYEPAQDEEMRVDFLLVSSDYFASVGIPFVRGRGIESSDDTSSQRVIVVSRFMAERYWAGRDPIGGSVRFGERDFEVVGVAEDTRWRGMIDTPTSYVFLALDQSPATMAQRFLTVAVRGSGDTRLAASAIRDEFRALDPELSLTSLEAMDDRVSRVLMPQRLGSTVLSFFALLALSLALVGIYGVVSYTARQQSRSIGIRMALGATRWDVLRMVMRDGAGPVLFGMVFGIMGAVLLTRSVEAFLVGVSPHDLVTFVATVALLGGTAVIATFIPARRAASVDPMIILRHE